MATDDFKPAVGCRSRMKPLSMDGLVDAEVLEFETPRRMVWSWSVDDRNPPSKVTFMLARDGAGTRFRLRHVGEFDPEWRAAFWLICRARFTPVTEILGGRAARVPWSRPEDCTPPPHHHSHRTPIAYSHPR